MKSKVWSHCSPKKLKKIQRKIPRKSVIKVKTIKCKIGLNVKNVKYGEKLKEL